jgi:predicted MFS family arabinose efflux permease
MDTASHGLSDVVGPAAAGTLVAFAGPEWALGAIALTYAAAALSISGIRRPREPWPPVNLLLVQAIGAVVRVVRQPTLRGLAVSYSLYEVCWGMLIVVVPVVAVKQFDARASGYIAGLLWAGLGIAGGISALIAGHLRTAGRERRVMAVGMLATAFAVWPLAAEFGFMGLVFGLMLVGVMAGPIDVGALTLRQRRTPPAELGRVLSVSMSLNSAGAPLGSALAGALIGSSLFATFAVAAFAAVLAGFAVALIPARDNECDYRQSVATVPVSKQRGVG